EPAADRSGFESGTDRRVEGLAPSAESTATIEAMADQLSLRLEPDPAGWPAPLRPMLAQPAAGPFDDPDVLFEPWWGGERAPAHVGRDRVDPTGSGGDRGPLALELRLVGADGVLL